MNLLDNILLAINAIASNTLRTVLTCLIIAFGIMALVGILTAVDGMKAALNSNFATMGANNFDIRKMGTGIRVGRRGRKAQRYLPITLQQALDFKERYNYPATVSLSFNAAFAMTLKYQAQKTNPNIQVIAGDENYVKVGGFDIGYGRNFTAPENESGRHVVVLGNGVAEKLFTKAAAAIDKTVSIGNRKFRVVGVLAPKGATSIFSSDNAVIIPLLTAKSNYASNSTTYVITVSLSNAVIIEEAISEAVGLMRNVRRLDFSAEEDFEISKSDKLSTLLIDQSASITTAATIIGFITLLGGAIGLMNIMLVSVTERTREIGISKALGATKRVITTQFLVEAIVICQLGGLLGIALGILAGNAVSLVINGPFIIPWLWIIGGMLLCLFVGLISGLYPALKAASVDPIESLRYE